MTLAALVGPMFGATAAQAATYGAPEQIASGLDFPGGGLTLDPAGDVFLTNANSGSVTEVAADGAKSQVGSFVNADSVAYDASTRGLAVADYGNQANGGPAGAVDEVTTSGARIATFPGGDPGAVAVDSLGDIYFGEENDIGEITGNTTNYPVVAPDDVQVEAVGVDADNDIFAIEQNTQNHGTALVEYSEETGEPTTLASNVFYGALAVDAAGDSFVAEASGAGGYDIVEIPVDGPQTTVATGVVRPGGIALDSAGDVYYTDNNNGTLDEAPLQDATAVVAEGCGPAARATVAQTCQVAVRDTTSSQTTPTGTVTFSSGGQGTFPDGDSCTLTNGACSVTYTPTVVGTGTQVLAANYAGAERFTASSIDSETATVKGKTPVVSLTCEKATGPGQGSGARTCAVKVRSSATGYPTPTGSVGFSIKATTGSGSLFSPETCLLSAKGGCSSTFSPPGAGTYVIVAKYESDATYKVATAQYTATIKN